MGCELRDTLGIQYLEVVDLVRHAERRLNHAVTLTNIECAKTELRRVEEYRQDTLRDIVNHCERHGCATLELEGICGLELVARRMVA